MLRASASLEDFSMRLLIAGKHSWCSEPQGDRSSPVLLFLCEDLNYVLNLSESSESLSPGCALQKDKKAKGSKRLSQHCGCALGSLFWCSYVTFLRQELVLAGHLCASLPKSRNNQMLPEQKGITEGPSL